jgi:hypothetical protein
LGDFEVFREIFGERAKVPEWHQGVKGIKGVLS